MLKLVIAMRRHPTLSRQKFRTYHSRDHVAVLTSAKHFVRHIRGYSQVQALSDSNGPAPYSYRPTENRDAVVSLWYDDLDALSAAFAEPEYRTLIMPDEARFVFPSDPDLIFMPTVEIDLMGAGRRSAFKLLEFIVRGKAVESAAFQSGLKAHCRRLTDEAPIDGLPTTLVLDTVMLAGDARWPAPPYDAVLEAGFDTVADMVAWAAYRRNSQVAGQESDLVDGSASVCFAGEEAEIFPCVGEEMPMGQNPKNITVGG